MSPESRLVTAVCLLAWRAARAAERPLAPERTGTFLGSGFGCLATTAEYLGGIFRDGMAGASPALFAESLPSAPLGHAAIALDARGPSMAFAGGDASVMPALAEASRAIRHGRIDRAVCGAFELMPEDLLRILARLAARSGRVPHVGEGAVALVLEDLDQAVASGARILAEVLAVALSGDPAARPTGWSEDPRAWADAHAKVLRRLDPEAPPPRAVFLHAPPSRGAGRAEATAVAGLAAVERRAPRAQEPPDPGLDPSAARTAYRGVDPMEPVDVHRVFGSYAAAGGLTVVAAALQAAHASAPALVSAGAWGGLTAAAVIGPPGA